jgi:hypothetical protein
VWSTYCMNDLRMVFGCACVVGYYLLFVKIQNDEYVLHEFLVCALMG